MRTWSAFIIAVLLMIFCLCSCGKGQEQVYFTSPAELNDSRYSIGVGMGTADIHTLEKYLPNANVIEYSSTENGYLAVQAGMLDAFAYSVESMQYAMASGSLKGVRLLDERIGEGTDIVVGISRKTTIPDLKQKIDDFIAATHDEGTFDDMYNRWVVMAADEMPVIPKPEHPDFKIIIGTSGTAVPFSYYKGEELTGMDLELIARFANYLNAEVEIVVLDYIGLSAASETGAIDCVFANLHATPERRESMDFSIPIYKLQTGLMVRTDEAVPLSVDDYDGRRFGVQTGSIHETIIEERFPHAEISYFSSFGDMIAGVKSGIIDTFSCASSVAKEVCEANPSLTWLDERLGSNSCAFAFDMTEDGQLLCDQMSAYIQKLKADGTLDEIFEKWDNDTAGAIDLSVLPTNGRTLTFATSAETKPFSYIRDGNPAGYEVEIAVGFCREYGYGLEMKSLNFEGIIPGLLSGLYDFAGDSIVITEERAKSVLFSEPDYEDDIVLIVKDGSAAANDESFWQSIQKSFEKTFIREQRWKLIVRGIGTTIFISVLSALFGTLLGFGICMLRRMKNPFIHALTTVYIRILQGTPLVVLLMVLFYLVFPGTGLSGEWVAIIGFSLNFAAYVSEMMRTGIDAVDIGQTEAALALGYPKSRAFFRFILPQAAQNFLPVYKGEFISLVKMTSVVGYIAVQDLTKMSDLIRSRTYEAFFPLITTAAIYFVISWLLTLLLRYVEIKIEPDRTNRTVKGVTMQ